VAIDDRSREQVWNSGGGLSFDDECPWVRCGLPDPLQACNSASRLLHGFFYVASWMVMPLAVLTVHGWVGLLVHGLALSGAAGLLQRAVMQKRFQASPQLAGLRSREGDDVGASESKRF
jgi:hypothetical protein